VGYGVEMQSAVDWDWYFPTHRPTTPASKDRSPGAPVARWMGHPKDSGGTALERPAKGIGGLEAIRGSLLKRDAVLHERA